MKFGYSNFTETLQRASIDDILRKSVYSFVCSVAVCTKTDKVNSEPSNLIVSKFKRMTNKGDFNFLFNLSVVRKAKAGFIDE